MAEVYEKDLGSKGTLTSSDFIRVVGSDNVSYKQPMNTLPSALDGTLSTAQSASGSDLVRINSSGTPKMVSVDNLLNSVNLDKTWFGFQNRVMNKTAQAIYPVGTQLTDVWAESAGGTQYETPWDVVNYDTSGNCYLKWHYAYPTGVPFDEPEAIYYASGTLAAGTYYIGIGADYGTGWSTSKHIQITTHVAMNSGDQIVISLGANNATDPTNGRTWNMYAAGSTTSKDSGTTSNGTSGTSLGSTSATGVGYTSGNVNSPQRAVYGYGRWAQSAVRQWLNSSAAAGSWWSVKNPWDRPPAVAATLRGFLAGFSESFTNILQPVDVVTAINTVEGSASTTETTSDKIFLPSLQEMYITPQLANVEGVDWEYFQQLAINSGLTGKFAQGGTYPLLITYNLANTTSPVYVWLRSASRGYANGAWHVYSSGYVGGTSAGTAFRGCPACKILSS